MLLWILSDLKNEWATLCTICNARCINKKNILVFQDQYAGNVNKMTLNLYLWHYDERMHCWLHHRGDHSSPNTVCFRWLTPCHIFYTDMIYEYFVVAWKTILLKRNNALAVWGNVSSMSIQTPYRWNTHLFWKQGNLSDFCLIASTYWKGSGVDSQ